MLTSQQIQSLIGKYGAGGTGATPADPRDHMVQSSQVQKTNPVGGFVKNPTTVASYADSLMKPQSNGPAPISKTPTLDSFNSQNTPPARENFPDQSSYVAAHKQWRMAGATALGKDFKPVADGSVLDTPDDPNSGILPNAIKHGAASLDRALDRSNQNKQGNALTALDTAGAVAQPAVETVGAIFKPLGWLADQVLNKGAGRLANSITLKDQNGKVMSQGQNKPMTSADSDPFQYLRPDVRDHVESALNVIQLALMAKGGEKASPELQQAVDTLKPRIQELASNLGEQGKSMIEDFQRVSDNKKIAKGDALAGKITQGDATDIPSTKNTLSNIDLSAVDNAPKGQKYQALTDTLNSKVEELSNAKGQALSSNKDSFRMPELGTKVGSKYHNFVQDALDQLQSYYEKTNNVKGQGEIEQLRSKAETNGLTIKEIDDLAIRHGQDLNGFNANGELASGLTKQAAENTRMGVKDTARDLFGHDAYKAADSELSDTIRTRNLTKKVAEKANELTQRIQQRGLGEKIGYYGGKVFNTILGGGPKGLIEYFMGRGTGLKTLNALDLDAQLVRSLKKLQSISESTSDAELVSKLNDAIAENQAKPERGGTSTQTIKPAELNYNGPADQGSVQINNYQNPYPKFFTPDQFSKISEYLIQKENMSKPIDVLVREVTKKIVPVDEMKLKEIRKRIVEMDKMKVRSVKKKITPMNDISPRGNVAVRYA